MTFGKKKINTFISILFAPAFVLGIYFFDFESVALYASGFMFVFLLYALFRKQKLKQLITPLVYFIFMLLAYFLHSVSVVKLIPALLSAGFFFAFLFAYLAKKEMVLSFAKRFSPKEIDSITQEYLASSDIYWVFVLLLNTLIQLFLVFYDDNRLWAFYSSLGWYIYLFVALTLQIIYVKMQIKKKGEGL